MASNDENEYVFRFKCDCGEIHEVSYPRRNNVNIRVRNCKSRVILHWDGKGFAIVKQGQDRPDMPKGPSGGGRIHDRCRRHDQRIISSEAVFGFGVRGVVEEMVVALEVIYSETGTDRWPGYCIFSSVPNVSFTYHGRSHHQHGGMAERVAEWGFSLCDDAVHFNWGEDCKFWNLPCFNKVHQRHEVRRADGSWVPYVGSYEHNKTPDGREEFVLPYAYRLRNDELQQRKATVFVERRAWRPRWFEWTSLFEKSYQSIAVEFDDEVGERTGSWKGGCVGCGYTMLPGETPKQTLRRMERERFFA